MGLKKKYSRNTYHTITTNNDDNNNRSWSFLFPQYSLFVLLNFSYANHTYMDIMEQRKHVNINYQQTTWQPNSTQKKKKRKTKKKIISNPNIELHHDHHEDYHMYTENIKHSVIFSCILKSIHIIQVSHRKIKVSINSRCAYICYIQSVI